MLCADERCEPGQNLAGPLIHSQAECFGREDVSQLVDHQARQAVRFGMDDAVRIRHVVELEQFAPQLHRSFEFPLPKRLVRQVIGTAEQANRDFGPRIVETIADKASFAIVDSHRIPAWALAAHMSNPFAIEQRMQTSRFDDDFRQRTGRIDPQCPLGRIEQPDAAAAGGLSNRLWLLAIRA